MTRPAWQTEELDEAWVEHPFSDSGRSNSGSPSASALDFGSLVVRDSLPLKSPAARTPSFGHVDSQPLSPISETGTLVLKPSPTGSESAGPKSQVAWAAAAIASRNLLEMSDGKPSSVSIEAGPSRLASLFKPPTPPESQTSLEQGMHVPRLL
jgi:hypothetical protein